MNEYCLYLFYVFLNDSFSILKIQTGILCQLDKFRESNNVALPILCHRYAAHFRLSVLLLPHYQCNAPKKQPCSGVSMVEINLTTRMKAA